jgi:hypothetical protein
VLQRVFLPAAGFLAVVDKALVEAGEPSAGVHAFEVREFRQPGEDDLYGEGALDFLELVECFGH